MPARILILRLGGIALTLLAAAIPLSLGTIPALAADTGAMAVVSEDAVAASPYALALAPDGEFRVLHFDAGLVTSVLVAKPWLLTVLIQGSDVVLQAKGSSGSTQLICYVGGTGTLWRVTIEPHGPAPTRIVVRAPEPAPVTAGPVSSSAAVATASAPAPQPSGPDPRLAAFLDTLTPAQRSAFAAWQEHPTGAALDELLASFTTAQQAAFNTLVAAGVVHAKPILPNGGAPVSSGTAAPLLVDTTTVIGPATSPAVPVQGGGAAQAAPGGGALAAVVRDVPAGVTVTATAAPVQGGVEIRYTIHNGSTESLGKAQVTATDSTGHSAAVDGAPTGTIAPGHDLRGTLTVHSASLPVVVQWTWTPRRGAPTSFAIGIS